MYADCADDCHAEGRGFESHQPLSRSCFSSGLSHPFDSVLHRRGRRSTGASGTIAFVPTISRFYGITVAMYFDDHEPPHFHARHAEGGTKVRIDTLEAIESTLGRPQLRLVLAWAELHQDELRENWRRARAGETLQPIEPLR
jgi:hypothetical protein